MRLLLREVRQHLGMQQDDVAALCQVSKSTVSRWESGDVMMKIVYLARFARATNLSLDALVCLEPEAVPAGGAGE